MIVDPAVSTMLRAAADAVRSTVGLRAGNMVEDALRLTLTDTVTIDDDGSAFVITGDIRAMWLRDSTTQMLPYLRFAAACPPVAELLAAVVRRQFRLIEHDPYANAFNRRPSGAHHDRRDRCDDPLVWEQKYELDSLAYPILLAHRLRGRTGRDDVFDERSHRVCRIVVDQWTLEQDHDRSTYRFVRDIGIPTETLARDGRGRPVAVTGMTWSAFRPSDDAGTFGYNVPENLHAAQALVAVADVARAVWHDEALAADADALRDGVLRGVAEHGIVERDGERVYAYEVDGLGGVAVMDDANMPSLLSLPIDAPDVIDPEVAAATRRHVLGPANPYWFSGSAASGIGSSHTRPGRVWPIALAVEGLTGTPERRRELLDVLLATDAGTGRMHESFDVDEPRVFSRAWFSWADSMFCELALTVVDDARDAAGSGPLGHGE
ncbi:glycoside hydrolase family 125 protein [Curtobacterium sp. RRHDQ10]|uniref:glycoside hydrolase family 125 protein n=1 Tax=Curtobacterium phyllosphaerae TaxID=3413379 RepID=UPI003BF018A5